MFVAYIAMLSKQWLNHHVLDEGGSMIERCWDRQRRCDLLEKRFSGPIARAPPVLLQTALALLVLGFCFGMLVVSPVFGVVLLCIVVPPSTYILFRIRRTFPDVLTPRGLLALLRSVRENTKREIPHLALHPLQTLSTIRVGPPTSPWSRLIPNAPDTIRETAANDIRCVSWILRSVTNPEALDAAIRFAGTILWFEDRIDAKPPYGLILSTFEGYFTSNGKMYPGMGDRRDYFLQAFLWIRVRAMCVSEEFAAEFPLPNISCGATSHDADSAHLLGAFTGKTTHEIIAQMYRIVPGLTPAYFQWVSDVLLHLSWAKQGVPGIFDSIGEHSPGGDWRDIPSSAALNRLLVWCIFLGWHIDEDALRIQDKSCVISFLPSKLLTLL